MHRGSSSILLATFFKHPVESLHFEACNPFSFLKLALLSTGMMLWISKFAFHWCPALLKRISLVLWFWLWPRLVTSKVALKGISVVPPPQNWPWLWMGLAVEAISEWEPSARSQNGNFTRCVWLCSDRADSVNTARTQLCQNAMFCAS